MDSEKLHWICSVPIGATIAALGLLGNIISIVVWYRLSGLKSRRNKSTAMYFITLAFCDSLLLTFFLLHDTLPTSRPEVKENYYFAAIYAWFLFPMFFFSLVASIWIVVGITVNRYVMIAFPTKVQVLYSNTRSKIGILAILVFAFTVNLPHFFTYEVKNVNGTYSPALTEYGASDHSVNYEFWAHCIVLVLGPWACIAIINGLIVRTLKKQMKKFRQLTEKVTKQEIQERQMTRTLLFITFTFLILLAWQCITQCFWMLRFGEHDAPDRWKMVDKSFALAKLGVIINSSINWVFYCFTCSMFRKELRKLFGLKKHKERDAYRMTTETTMTSFSSSKGSSMPREKSIVIANTNL